MARPAKPARLYLRRTPGRPAVWVILDHGREISTGCGEADHGGAEKQFHAHLGRTYKPASGPRPLDAILIADVMTIYLREHAPRTKSLDEIICSSSRLLEWWGERTLGDIRGRTCRAYAAWRTSQPVQQQATKLKLKKPRAVRFASSATARADLAYLSAAIGYYHEEHGPLPAVPAVVLPDRAEPRERWLRMAEAARLIRAAWRNRDARHVARFGLLGLYTGTRSQALLRLRWIPSTAGGWVDLDNGVIHRRGAGVSETSKRQPVMKIPDRLLPHLRRWRARDMAVGITYVVHFQGAPITKLRRSWATARRTAGLSPDVTPHILRHTCATWKMQAGADKFEAAGFLGMSIEMLERVYGHHHPDFQSSAANATRRRAPMKSQETPRTKRDETTLNDQKRKENQR